MKTSSVAFGHSILRSVLILSLFDIAQCTSKPEEYQDVKSRMTKDLFIGTYTRDEGQVDGKADGIYKLVLDNEGKIIEKITAVELMNPSYLTLDTARNILYSVSETGPDDGAEGSLLAFQLSVSGKLETIDSVGSGAYYPCHVAINKAGNLVLVSNYVGGVVSVFKSDNGKLSLLQKLSFTGSGSHLRQNASHTHMAKLSPSEDFLFVTDLGSNVIWNFKWDADEQLFLQNELQIRLKMEEGFGPRHLVFHPKGHLAAVINELDNSVSLLSYSHETGVLEVLDSKSILSREGEEIAKTAADIHFHPNGRFLYGSQRGENIISVFAIISESKLQLIQQISSEGEIPRNFAISKDGKVMWVANQNSNNIAIFQIDIVTGLLTYSKQYKDILTPVCIVGR